MKKKTKPAAKKQMLSTSEARANFAEALGMAQEESTVIGFDRYGKLVAAVVPIDAVRMLAGRGSEVEPSIRSKIERMSRIFLQAAPVAAPEVREVRTPFSPEPKKKRKRSGRKGRTDRRAKAAGKRARRISRKI